MGRSLRLWHRRRGIANGKWGWAGRRFVGKGKMSIAQDWGSQQSGGGVPAPTANWAGQDAPPTSFGGLYRVENFIGICYRPTETKRLVGNAHPTITIRFVIGSRPGGGSTIAFLIQSVDRSYGSVAGVLSFAIRSYVWYTKLTTKPL